MIQGLIKSIPMKKYLQVLFFVITTMGVSYSQTSSSQDTCKGNTFVKTLGNSGTIERGLTICPSGDGNFYLTASKPDSALILKINPEGGIIWKRSFDIAPGYDNITQLIVDSDGMLDGCCSSSTSYQAASHGTYFRYDPVKDIFLWRNELKFPNNDINTFFSIIESKPGGSFYIGFPSYVNSDIEIVEVDRNSGMIIPNTSWRYYWTPPYQRIQSMVLYNGLLYGTGWGYPLNSALGKHAFVACINPADGQMVWAQFGHIPLDQNINLIGDHLVVSDSSIVSVFCGNEFGISSLDNYVIFLQKMGLDGTIQWVRKFDLADFHSERVSGLIRTVDGYVISGWSENTSPAQGDQFLLKTDLNGNLKWATHYYAGPSKYGFNQAIGNRLINLGDFTYFSSFAPDSLNLPDILLAKVGANGFISDSCAYFQPEQVIATTIPNPVGHSALANFQNLQLEQSVGFPLVKTASAALPAFRTLPRCDHECHTDTACDIKTNGCIVFELLGITLDAVNRRHYRVRITNKCAGQELEYVAIQLPPGIVASSPANGSTFVAESGKAYEVRNTNESPMYSIRFKPVGAGPSNGASEIFEYSLPPQSEPLYINVFPPCH
jgi:hypothetical protein